MKRVLSIILSGVAIGIIAVVVFNIGQNAFKEITNTNNDIPVVESTTAAKEEETTKSIIESNNNRQQYSNYEYSNVVDLVDDAMPSVVSITNIQKYIQNGYSIFGFKQQSREVEVPASGSGVIVGITDSEVIMVTNNHVVTSSSSLSVTFNDGGEAVEAAIKGVDANKDLAVVAVSVEKIPNDVLKKLKAIPLGNSDNIKVGEGVVAIGNALGIGQSVTTGIVSAKDRIIDEINDTEKLIQTDAAINPGNSGGALINMKGELIGINVAKSSGTAIEGMGYAIPINIAKEVIDTLSSKKTRETIKEEEQGFLGITARNIDSQTAQSLDMPEGIYVFKITEDGAAAKSEMKEKDIIVAFDDQNIKTLSELQDLLKYTRAGTEVNVKVKRLDGSGTYVDKEFKVTLGNRPKTEETTQKETEQQNNRNNNNNGNGMGQGDNFYFGSPFDGFNFGGWGW